MKVIFLALGMAFLVCVLTGPWLIPLLWKLKFGQHIRSEGPQRHMVKAGTPTMGGIMIISAVFISALAIGGLKPEIITLICVTLGYGIIGLLDDGIKVVKKRNLGLTGKEKLAGQILVGIIFALLSTLWIGLDTKLQVPLTGNEIELGWLYYPFVVLVLIATSNSVNLTDGLDGLATGVTAFAAAAYVLIAHLTGLEGVVTFGAALVGACLGFLVFNSHPARIFMGDTGSLALGGALAGMAILTGTELILPIIGAVFVVETLSVIIQVISFQSTGKRIFRMSPLHHHFELVGWHEKKVVFSFWAAGLISGVIGILLATI